MANTQDRHGNAVTNNSTVDMTDGSKMDRLGHPQAQTLASRIPAPAWSTTAKVSGTDTSAKETTGTQKSSGIRPPQVRTNPRVTRQGMRSKNDSDGSNNSRSVSSPKVSRTQQDLETCGVGRHENLSPLSPSSSLTRQGAFRYGRGVKPLEVLNLGSGAATVPRMRPKGGGRDTRNLDIFTKPEVLDSPSRDDAGYQVSKKEDQTKRERPSTPTKRTSQRPQSLGRAAGTRQKAQRDITTKIQPVDSTTGPKISKGIRGGGGPPKGPDFSRVSKSLESDHQSQKSAGVECPREQTQPKNAVSNSEASNKEGDEPKNFSRTNRSVKVEQPLVEMSPKAPPRRHRTLPTSTNGSSSTRTPIPKSSRIPQGNTHSKEQVSAYDTPKPPPRRPKAQPLSPHTVGSKSAPTNIPRAQSHRQRDSHQLGQTKSLLSPRHSLPSSPAPRLSNKSSLSFPQGTKSLGGVAAVKDREQRQRSRSASQIPVPISRRSSLPQYRPVKLRPKVPKSDRPTQVFRLSLEGVDSGTEYSSSLATTPSECSVDIDLSYEEGSPVCQTMPAKFYTISGVEGQTQNESSSENLGKTHYGQQTEKSEQEESSVKIAHISEPSSASDRGRFHTWHQDNTATHIITPITAAVPEDKEMNPEEFGPGKTTKAATSEIKGPGGETLASEISTSDSSHSTKSADHTESTDCLRLTNSSELDEHSKTFGQSAMSASDAKRNFEAFSESKKPEENSPEKTDAKLQASLPYHPDVGHSKAKSFVQNRMGREIALKVARGDLKASSVDGDGESFGHLQHLNATHSLQEPEDSGHKEGPSMGTVTKSGNQEGTEVPKRSRRSRKISSIESPHTALKAAESVSREDHTRRDISGSTILEKMMDTEEAIPRPNHRKNSFHRYATEKTKQEENYLRSCSDPIKLLEFLMNIDDPPKVRGYKGEWNEAVVVKRRTKSDVSGLSERVAATKGSNVNRWSMPTTREQWSQTLWAHLKNNGRSCQDSHLKEIDTVPANFDVSGVSDGRVPVTSGTVNTNKQTNSTSSELEGIQNVRRRRFSSSSKGTKDNLQKEPDSDSNRQSKTHRWSVPVEAHNILPSVGDAKVTEPTKEPTELPAGKSKNSDQPLKRKSWWRWSFPVTFGRSPRSSVCAKDPNSKSPSQQAHDTSPTSRMTHPSPSSRVNGVTEHSTPYSHPREHEKRAPSFTDIAGSSTPSLNTVKVFIDRTYAEKNSGLHCPNPTVASSSSTSSSLMYDKNFLCISTDNQAPASLKADTAQDESATSPAVILRDQDSRTSEPHLKKRLSWRREQSLETVCYLERQESGSEHKGISAKKEYENNESLGPHPLQDLIVQHRSKDDSEIADDSYTYILTDDGEDSTRTCKTAPVNFFAPWVLPPDELKSKLESVYAERQKEEEEDKEAVWKLDPNSRNSFQSGSSGLEADSGTSPRGVTVYHPSETTMRDTAAMSTGIGKRLSLKQQLSVDSDLDSNRQSKETTGLLNTGSIKEAHSGSRSPISDGTFINNNRPKLNRPRSSSGSGSESTKDTMRKLDDVSHKTRLRIERDREIKTSISPSSPATSEPSQTTPPRSRKKAQGLVVPSESQLNGESVGDKNQDVRLGESMQAFRRRKKSMAIALSEGLLDLQAEHASPSEKASELTMVSQISQLNQELMQLTQNSPPGTPPTPGYLSKGSLQRSSSRGSLASLPGSSSSFPGLRLWKSVSQFQTTSDDSANGAPSHSLTLERDKSVTSPEIKKTSPLKSLPKEEEDSREGKMVSPKVLLSRIKQWSKKKGQPKPRARPEIVKLDPDDPPEEEEQEEKTEQEEEEADDNFQIPRAPLPLSDTTSIHNNTPELPHRSLVPLRPVPMNRDMALRQTWHGTPYRKPDEDGEGEDQLVRSNFKRCNSLRNPVRQRKRGLSPIENAHLVAMHLSTETIPVSSVDSGIVKDRVGEELHLAGDSDSPSSNLCSPSSSLGSSNPPSRPLSSDIADLQWEKGLGDSQNISSGGVAEERKLSAVTLGRRESGTGMTKARKPLVTRLSLGSQLAVENQETVTSPKKVTFSVAEEITKRVVEEDLKRLPKPLHLPRRAKTDPGDMKTIAGALKEFEDEEGSSQMISHLRRRAHSELASINERDWEDLVMHPPVIREERGTTSRLSRPKSIPDHMSLLEDQDVETAPRKNSLADLIGTEVGEVLTSFGSQYNFEAYCPDTMPTFAEALWDHVTMDESELAFKAGDVIEVTDMKDRNWWWGCMGNVEGWVPAQFVRLRVSQGETVEECMERLKEEREQSKTLSMTKRSRKVSLSFLSNDQVRAKVVEEIITTERDYVRNLRDVCEGYITQALDRPEMFSEEIMNNLFGNIEEIYSFQKGFLLQLEASIISNRPHLSRIGSCFLEHKRGFETYSEYCNNYPNALREVKQLREKQKYGQFFEACRLLQNMIEINLEGFLLTPVQKICKYPLQLRELLKYTRPQHADYHELQEALEVMKDVAITINDRKRRIENIEKIAAFQKGIGDWEGEDLLDQSTQLIHSGDITMLAGKRWTSGRRAFLFDHQLVVCKKDWKGTLLYKKRMNLNAAVVSDMPDGKDSNWNVTVRHAFKLHDYRQNKLHIFTCKTEEEKKEWLKMFAKERDSVMKDKEKGFSIPSATREAAMKNVMGGDQRPSKPQDVSVVTRKVSTMPYAYQHKILETPNKKVPLPKGISSSEVFKKKGKGLFGIGKK